VKREKKYRPALWVTMKSEPSPTLPARGLAKSGQNSNTCRPWKSSASEKGQKRIPQMSQKRKSEYRIYQALSKSFLSEHPKCQRCGKQSDCVHHASGRGRNYLKVSTWIAVCNGCHKWIHSNPKAAQDAGLLAKMGKWMVAVLLSATTASAQVGGAYWYGDECRGRTMANNRVFDPQAMTCASWFHPLGSVVLVTRTDVTPNISIAVTVTDRGPARRLVRTQRRVIDLSQSAFSRIADTNLGHVRVVVERVKPKHSS
jgi:rare lipoprotein A